MHHFSLPNLHEKLKTWADEGLGRGATGIYAFGSLIYRNGEQFGEASDIDLVAMMPSLGGAAARARWLQSFAEHKMQLEGLLVPTLRRSAEEPIVSLVAVTAVEVEGDVHKDGHREFFSQNRFRDLSSGKEQTGLAGVGTNPLSRYAAAAVGFAQKIRNEYFATSYNTTVTLKPFNDRDPVPKRFMRAAAMAARAISFADEPGAEYDLQVGLDLLSFELTKPERRRNAAFRQLQEIISVRRAARGQLRPLMPEDLLLLGELIFDLATDVAPEGLTPDPSDVPSPGAGRPDNTGSSQTPTKDTGAGTASPLAKSTLRASIDTAYDPRPKMPFGSSSAFFADRFAEAFPEDRSTTWYRDFKDIAMRLGTLLRQPLVFKEGIPIWWWRGGNMHVESFERLQDGTYLMNDVEELDIDAIASVPCMDGSRSFVYIQSKAMPATGLYRRKMDEVDASFRQFGYESEEYGFVDGAYRITRQAHDDGRAVLDGQVVDVQSRSRLRVRYLSPYNFLLAPVGSVINNNRFDYKLEKLLNDALEGDREEILEHLAHEIRRLPKIRE